ncbi:MAG: hypothetical protein ACE5NP_10245 [Anaerolineae bacterium]
MFRPFGLRDIFIVKDLQQLGLQLDLERAIIWPQSPLMAALAARLPVNEMGAPTYVLTAEEKGRKRYGFIQIRPRPERPECDVVYLAPALSQASDPSTGQMILYRLLTHLCQEVGKAGCQRLFAALPDGGEEADVFRQVGFGSYCREYIYRMTQPPAPYAPTQPFQWRQQRAEDSWGLQRLYDLSTPHLVRQAEGLARGSWEPRYTHWLGRRMDRRYVLKQDNEVFGYLHLTPGRQGYWLRVMLHPDITDRAEELLRSSLAQALPHRPRPIYCNVREYQSGMQGALENCGFEYFFTRSIMVKHTTVRVRDFVMKPLPAMEKGVEASPTISQTNKVR